MEQLLANPLGELAGASLDAVPFRKSPYYGLDVHLHMTVCTPARTPAAPVTRPLPASGLTAPRPAAQMLGSPLRVPTAEEADIVFVPLYATFLGGGGFALFDAPGACSPANWTEQDRLAVLRDFYAEHEQHLPLLGAKPHWVPVRMQRLLHSAHARTLHSVPSPQGGPSHVCLQQRASLPREPGVTLFALAELHGPFAHRWLSASGWL